MDLDVFMTYNPDLKLSSSMKKMMDNKVNQFIPYFEENDYSIPIRHGSTGEQVKIDDLLTEVIKEVNEESKKEADVTGEVIPENTIQDAKRPIIKTSPGTHSGNKYNQFKKAFDTVAAENPTVEKYRSILTDLAKAESGFDHYIQNKAGAPAYGYFQFMQGVDPSNEKRSWNNIEKHAGVDIETFRNDPVLQIKAAIKLAQAFERGLSKDDLRMANEQGYTLNGLLAGAWAGGIGGVRKVLTGTGDPNDRHWDKENGRGTSVSERMKKYNYQKGGKLKLKSPL